jgi:hypothetical protein
MTNLKTKESTLQALEKASHKTPTSDEIRKQRISFIMGSLNKNSHVTRAKVQELLAEQEGLKSKKR